jgi:hypothetical protein
MCLCLRSSFCGLPSYVYRPPSSSPTVSANIAISEIALAIYDICVVRCMAYSHAKRECRGNVCHTTYVYRCSVLHCYTADNEKRIFFIIMLAVNRGAFAPRITVSIFAVLRCSFDSTVCYNRHSIIATTHKK